MEVVYLLFFLPSKFHNPVLFYFLSSPNPPLLGNSFGKHLFKNNSRKRVSSQSVFQENYLGTAATDDHAGTHSDCRVPDVTIVSVRKYIQLESPSRTPGPINTAKCWQKGGRPFSHRLFPEPRWAQASYNSTKDWKSLTRAK